MYELKKVMSLSMIAILLGAIGTTGHMLNSNSMAEGATGKQRIIYSADSQATTSSMNIAKKYLAADSIHVMGQGYWQNIEGAFDQRVYELAPSNEKMMFAASLQWMKDGIPIAKQLGVESIAYNAESWHYTPEEEQSSPIQSFNEAAAIAHNNGFKFAYNPTFSIFKGPDVNYLKQDWTKADILIIPFGGMVLFPSNFKLKVQEIADHVRSENPNIEIYIFVSLRYATPTQIIDAMDSVKTIVDGAAISYHPENGCLYCSEPNLDKMLAGITALGSGGTITPPPPPPPPSPGTKDLTFLYSSGSTTDSTTNIAKAHLTANATNYAAQGYSHTMNQLYNNEVYNAAPNNKKIMFAASLKALDESIPTAKEKGVTALAYNARIWKYSTSVEQSDPVAAFNQASQKAHNNGFKFAYAPSLGIFAGANKNYLKQDWTKADVLILPYADLVSKPTEFKASVEQAVSHIKAENPNIKILVHISLRNSSPDSVISAINLVRPVIDGTSLTHNPQDPGCSYCSDASLDKLLKGVAN